MFVHLSPTPFSQVSVRKQTNGLSGKLQQGDIIQIVSVDEENDEQAIIYDELQYVEVLATTADSGSDDTYDTDQVNASEDEENQPDLYATITVICQDRTQALRLAECENTTLHAVFVCRGDSEHKEEYLEAQRSVLGIEQIVAPDTPQNEPADTPDDENETADAPDLDLSAPVEETLKAEEPDKSAIFTSWQSCSSTTSVSSNPIFSYTCFAWSLPYIYVVVITFAS